jgi:hypothetical protein
MPRPKSTTPASPPRPSSAEEAFVLAKPAIDAVPRDALVVINLDIPEVVSATLGVLSRIRALRPGLARLPDFDLDLVDHLETYALAAWHAHLEAQRPGGRAAVHVLLEEATTLRLALLREAESLVHRGVFEGNAVAAIRVGQGHVDVANDLVALATLYEKGWKVIAGRSFVTEADVERAARLGSELLLAIGRREHEREAPHSAAGLTRARAYTLFAHAYEEVRRGVSYLRWYRGDAESIAPTLYRIRAPRKAPKKALEPADAGGEVVATPAKRKKRPR